MFYREIIRTLGSYLVCLAAALCVPFAVAAYYQFADPASHPQPHSTFAFAATIMICLALAVIFRVVGKKTVGRLYRREGLAVVVVIWFLTGIIGGLPFYLSGTLKNPVDAYFEAMSGLTTTGASVMCPKQYDEVTGDEIPIQKTVSETYDITYTYDGTIEPVRDLLTGEVLYEGVEAVGRGVLFWRSFLQWLGGMGIVVLFVAILPALGVGGRMLFQAEVPGPTQDAMTPRIKETASLLWKLYLGFTFLEIAFLLEVNPRIGWFDATTITFSNLSTGGFSVRNASISAYNSPAMEWVIIIFMLIGSINFALYFHCLRGKFYRLNEPEFLTYGLLLFVGCSLMVWRIYGVEGTLLTGDQKLFVGAEAVRTGIFHLVSAMTSTGFATADFDKWPYVPQALLLIVMFIGGMSGSTGGGIKIVRHLMCFRIVQNKVESIFYPERARSLRIGQSVVGQDAAITVLCFFLTVIALSVLGTLLLALDGVDLETALSINACMINNVGIAFRAAGPTGSFAFLSSFGKILATTWMVLGRLEFFAVLVILIPGFWRKS